MKKCWLAVLLLLLGAWTAIGQSTRVRGTVYDGETGEPLPFAGVYFDGTTIGISTDLDGKYSLETRSPDAKVLTAQLIGYQSVSIPVTTGAFSEVNFVLPPDPRQLEAALVKPDDRYIKSILRKLDTSLSVNDPDNGPDWNARLYSRIELDVTNMEDLYQLKFLDRNLGFMRNYTDTSAITGKSFVPAMISENVSDVYHSQDPSFTREVMRASRISGLEEDNSVRQFTGSYLLKTNFYKSNIGVFNLQIPNPAASSSHIFYNYFLVDSLDVAGRKTYVLRFHPKKLVTSPTLDGEMQIDAEDFGIRSVHCRLSPTSNVNWIRHINFDIENRRLPDGRWFYGDESLFIDFAITSNDNSRLISFLGNRKISYSVPRFEPITDPDALNSKEAVVMRDVTPGDDTYWEKARPFALTEREKGIYRMVEDFQTQSFYKWSYTIIRALVMNYIEVKPWKVEFGRWARTFAHNDTEGFRFSLGGRTLHEFSEKVRLGGYLAYGFKDRDLKWDATAEFMFNRERTMRLTLEAKRDYIQMGSGTGVFTAENMFSSIFARNHANMQSMVRSFDILYDHEFCKELNTQLEWKTSRIWANPSVPFISTADGLPQDSFSTNELHLQARISFDERVNRNYFFKRYIYTRYPVITLNVTKAFRGITAADVDYLKTDATIQWKVPSTAIGFGRLYLEGGAIFGRVPYPLLKLHEGNQTFFLDRTAFACMDYYEFASDRWLSGYYEHNFNGFFLGKIPLLKKLDLREVVTARFAWGTISPDNLENAPLQLPTRTGTLELPYVEVGAGISNILRILRVDAFWRVTHLRPEKGKNFTVNVGIDVEF